jgi:hypothetical protein
MLQSARVQPYSSCSPADWNLHLEGYGLVVLEWDNLAVEGGLIWALVRRKPDLVGEACEAEMVERG